MKLILAMAVLFSFAACSSPARLENANQPAGVDNKNSSASGDAGNQRFIINASQSQFTARVGVGGLLSALGHEHVVALRDFTGEAQATPGSLEPASLQLTINAGSTAETEKEFSESDRQKIDKAIHDEALEIAKYPQITFKSTRVSATKTGNNEYQVQIEGELTLHGVTRAITIPARVSLDGNAITARGEITIRHGDYQMKRISAAGGTVTAKDEIVLSFNVAGTKA